MQLMLSAFANTRTRIQRMRDARFFSGWMKDLSNVSARVALKGCPAIEVGEKFMVECHGKEKIAMFQAELSGISGEDAVLSVIGQVTYRPTSESARVTVHSVTGTIKFDGMSTEVEVVDVSENGMGLISAQSLTRGEIVEAILCSPCGEICCAGEVRYCKPDPDQFGKFRVGLALEPLDRLAGARWKRLYDSSV